MLTTLLNGHTPLMKSNSENDEVNKKHTRNYSQSLENSFKTRNIPQQFS